MNQVNLIYKSVSLMKFFYNQNKRLATPIPRQIFIEHTDKIRNFNYYYYKIVQVYILL